LLPFAQPSPGVSGRAGANDLSLSPEFNLFFFYAVARGLASVELLSSIGALL
jgi:hypothetical protein